MGDYKNFNYRVTFGGLNRKRQIIDKTLEDLHNMHMQMIEEAVALSDMKQANEVITYIKGKL
jgi:hypothetical protein